MTIRNVTKNFAGMEDLQCGVGQINQVRDATTYSMGKIDVPYAVNSEAEMQALDVTRFTNARVCSSSTEFTDYRYDAADVTGVLPVSGSGSWLIANRTKLANNLATVAALKASTLLVSGDVAETVGYYDGWAAVLMPQGGARYTIATLAEVRAQNGDGAWVPDEYLDHTLANGNVAVLDIGGEINVKTGGAKIDGSTDDYLPMLACAKRGRPLHIPKGICIIGTGLDYNALDAAGFDVRNVIWRGDGSDDKAGTVSSTTIKYTGSGVFLTLGNIPTNYQPTIVMDNLYLSGAGNIGHTAEVYYGFQTVTDGSSGTPDTQTCMLLKGSGVYHSKITNVIFRYWDVGVDQDSYVFGLNLVSCTFRTCNVGWRVGNNCTSSTAYKCEWAGCAVGVHLYSSNQNITIQSSTFEAMPAGTGMLISAGEATLIEGNYFADRFDIIGADAATPTNGAGVINTVWWRNNFGGSIYLGDGIRNIFFEKSMINTITNEYSFAGTSVTRRVVVEPNCYDIDQRVLPDVPVANFMKPLTATAENFLGAQVDEIIHGQGGTSCNRNGVQTLTTGVAEAIIWTSENYDENNLHSLSVTPERVIVDRPGKYNISSGLSYASNAVGYRRTEIRINGVIIAPDSRVPITGGNTQVSLSLTVELTEDDYIELWALQNSGGNLNTISAAGDRPYLNVQLLS